jgi:hypothetical protein
MNYWSRENTKEWIAQLEDRIEDIAHYIDKTIEWCDNNEIDDERVVFMCCFLTCIWVSQLRCEEISYIELMEILGVPSLENSEEKLYELDNRYADCTHHELLVKAVAHFTLDD